MPSEYYVHQGGKTHGPMEGSKLKKLAAAGKLKPTAKVGKSADGPWQAASGIAALKFPTTDPGTQSKPTAARQPDPATPAPASPATPLNAKVESDVWSGTPSQWTNAKTFALCLLFCWLVVPIFVAVWRFLVVRSRRYELTTQRLRTSEGVISQKLEELELYRVKDSQFTQTAIQRLAGLATVTLTTSDKSMPNVLIQSIKATKAKELRETVRELTEQLRRAKGIREIDGI